MASCFPKGYGACFDGVPEFQILWAQCPRFSMLSSAMLGLAMAKKNLPITPAIRALRAAKISFEALHYDYVEKGGTASSATRLRRFDRS